MKDAIHTIGNTKAEDGFTFIEMVGVLAVIAILVALLLPKVFEIIAESKVNALVAAVQTYETAIKDYYADIGSILPLDADGIPSTENSGDSANPLSLPARLTLERSDPLNVGTNSWVKFNGPYLAKFSTDTPPGIGSNITMRAMTATTYETATLVADRGYDFNDDGNNDLSTDADLVFIRLTPVERQEFERVDGILDAGVGTTIDEREKRGKVKYNETYKMLRIYLAHQ
ncbi:type II secretion system protein [Nitrospira sp. M1]